jgi:hypothetical protein
VAADFSAQAHTPVPQLQGRTKSLSATLKVHGSLLPSAVVPAAVTHRAGRRTAIAKVSDLPRKLLVSHYDLPVVGFVEKMTECSTHSTWLDLGDFCEAGGALTGLKYICNRCSIH